MQLYRVLIRPRTAFATPLKGDTLFGQCCWAIRRLRGEAFLVKCLEGYCQGRPFIVLSDAMPAGYFHRPAAPLHLLGLDADDPKQRKQIKAKRWLPEKVLGLPAGAWGASALTEVELGESLGFAGPMTRHENRTHNSLNRLTGTTGSGEAGFAPYDRALTWYHPRLTLAVYAAASDRVLLEEALTAVGQQGYGKEASSGLGKYDVLDVTPFAAPTPGAPDAWLTLAPCAPQGLPWRADHCYYEVFTRFGRHGDTAVQSGKPFKNPVLMANSFALLSPREFDTASCYTGQGLGGLSKAIEATVHQGYSPVWAIQLT